MSIGSKWMEQVERAGADQARRMIDAAERELGGLLPGARIERGAGEIRIAARGLSRRLISDPALRFFVRNLK